MPTSTPHPAIPGLRTLLSLTLALAPLATACTDAGEPGPPEVTTGAYHAYVQRGWTLPHDAGQAQTLGFDLDGDGTIDNQAGSLIGFLVGYGLELDGASHDAFTSGQLVALHRLRADSLVTDPSVEWRTYVGTPAEPPRFDGTDRFDVTVETGDLAGMLHDGRAELAWGDATISLPFFPDQSPLRLPLTDARMSLDVDGAGCNGRIGGGIRKTEIDGTILPNLAVEIIIHVARHPDHPFTATAMRVFDTDLDGALTVDEILASPLMRSLFFPDLDTDGDHVSDAISFGLGFDCVPATFTPPAT